MKYLFSAMMCLLLENSTFAAEKGTAEVEKLKSSQVSVTVKGMVCSFCAQGITKKFKAENAVSEIDVSLEKKTVNLNFKKDQDMPDSKIESLLKDAGYTVEKIAREIK